MSDRSCRSISCVEYEVLHDSGHKVRKTSDSEIDVK